MPPCQNSAYLQCDDIDQNSWLYVVEEEELWFPPDDHVVGHVSKLVLTARIFLLVSLCPHPLQLEDSGGRVENQQLLLVYVPDTDVDLNMEGFNSRSSYWFRCLILDTSVDHEANFSSQV